MACKNFAKKIVANSATLQNLIDFDQCCQQNQTKNAGFFSILVKEVMSNINTMNNNQNRGKIAYEKVLALVRKTKELSEVVKLGIRDLNNSTKDRSDKAIEDKAKIVDIAKLKYQKALEENQALSAEVESGKCRLNEVTLEYQAILEANNLFKKEEYALSNQTDVHADDQKRIDELRYCK